MGANHYLTVRGFVRCVVMIGLAHAAACGTDGSPTAPVLAGGLGEGVAGRWTTSTPAAQGLDAGVLADLEDRVAAGEFGDISSLLVLRHGILVYELYRDGWTPQDIHRAYSVTKSVTSLAIGVALEQGVVGNLGTPILELFPEYEMVEDAGTKASMTLEHVLQMRTGWAWDELSTNYSDGTNPTLDLVAAPDWLRFVLDLPMSDPPGTRFVYNSGASMLMAGVLANGTGGTAETYTADRLFDPLGIETWRWDSGPDGLTNSGWGLWLRPRDMAAIGQMVLQEGMWHGTRIVPPDWLARSAFAATRFSDGTGYGYQWWLPREDGFRQPLAAWGYGGQFIVIVPGVDLVMVSTAENYAGGGFDPYSLIEFGYRAAGARLNLYASPTGSIGLRESS